jgi:hypothetical protein
MVMEPTITRPSDRLGWRAQTIDPRASWSVVVHQIDLDDTPPLFLATLTLHARPGMLPRFFGSVGINAESAASDAIDEAAEWLANLDERSWTAREGSA